MTSPLAKTIFQTSVDDSLVTVDVYKGTSSNAIINVSSLINSSDIASFLGLNKSKINAALSFDINKGITLTSADISASIVSANSNIQSNFSLLDNNLRNQLLDPRGFNLVSISDPNNLALPSVTTHSSNANNILGITGILNSVSKTISVGLQIKDITANVSFLNNLVRVSASLNIPGAYTRIAAGGYSSDIMNAVTKSSLKIAISSSNLYLLADLSKGSLSGNIKGMLPNFCSSFAANFKFSPGTPTRAYSQIAANMNNSFSRIDVNWAKSSIGNRTTVNANLFFNASKDFKLALKYYSAFSRQPIKSTTPVTSIVPLSSIPNESTLQPGSLLSENFDGSSSVKYANGTLSSYFPIDENTANNTVSYADIVPNNESYYDTFNNSNINDSLTQGHAFSTCLAGGDNLTDSPIAPYLDASESISQNYPLAALSNLPILA